MPCWSRLLHGGHVKSDVSAGCICCGGNREAKRRAVGPPLLAGGIRDRQARQAWLAMRSGKGASESDNW